MAAEHHTPRTTLAAAFPSGSGEPTSGFWMLFYKEWLRFWKVSVQTVLAPLLTALLYLVVFAYTLRSRVEPLPGVDYTAFLVPGLAMMTVLQNAFANSASSLVQSKMQGSIIFVLLPPLSNREFFLAYLLAAMARGCLVGLAVIVSTVWFVHLEVEHPLWIGLFCVLGSGVMGALGVIVGVRCERVDQLAAMQSFVILPLTFLSGVFYSVHALPSAWQIATRFNPIFYMTDGFRFGFFGVSDVSPWLSAAIVAASFVAVSLSALWMIASGYKLRH
jgi:ABC-2 type transport system permease protein